MHGSWGHEKWISCCLLARNPKSWVNPDYSILFIAFDVTSHSQLKWQTSKNKYSHWLAVSSKILSLSVSLRRVGGYLEKHEKTAIYTSKGYETHQASPSSNNPYFRLVLLELRLQCQSWHRYNFSPCNKNVLGKDFNSCAFFCASPREGLIIS